MRIFVSIARVMLRSACRSNLCRCDWACASALRKRKAHQVSKVPLLLCLAAREPGEIQVMHWLAIRLPARSQWLG